MKKKAIEICRNLTATINNMVTKSNKVESTSTAYESTRVKKSTLVNRKKELMAEYNLTAEDLK
tara:strand:+ start:3947 stop:4135 length:189 start_codon:yes stop_codon:yes gene_type:complete